MSAQSPGKYLISRPLPGLGLHDELKLLAQAGLTPLEAQQAATRGCGGILGTARFVWNRREI